MDLIELAEHPASEVRNSEELMQAYIEGYKSVFGKTPNCTTCHFTSDFKRFKTKVLPLSNDNQKPNTMENYKIRAEFRNEILSYKKGKQTIRRYGRDLTDEFASEYLKNASKQVLEQREAKFSVLPKKKSDTKEKPVSKKLGKTKNEADKK